MTDRRSSSLSPLLLWLSLSLLELELELELGDLGHDGACGITIIGNACGCACGYGLTPGAAWGGTGAGAGGGACDAPGTNSCRTTAVAAARGATRAPRLRLRRLAHQRHTQTHRQMPTTTMAMMPSVHQTASAMAIAHFFTLRLPISCPTPRTHLRGGVVSARLSTGGRAGSSPRRFVHTFWQATSAWASA